MRIQTGVFNQRGLDAVRKAREAAQNAAPLPSSPLPAPLVAADGYRAALACCRCGSVRFVPMLAEDFRYWFCHRADTGIWCGTFNVADPKTWKSGLRS